MAGMGLLPNSSGDWWVSQCLHQPGCVEQFLAKGELGAEDSVDSKCRSYRNCRQAEINSHKTSKPTRFCDRWHRKVSVKCSLRCPSFTAFMH